MSKCVVRAGCGPSHCGVGRAAGVKCNEWGVYICANTFIIIGIHRSGLNMEYILRLLGWTNVVCGYKVQCGSSSLFRRGHMDISLGVVNVIMEDRQLPMHHAPPLHVADGSTGTAEPLQFGTSAAAGAARRKLYTTTNCLRDSDSGFFLDVYS